jgi:uncharacterized protein GlcG (DUF336 family)
MTREFKKLTLKEAIIGLKAMRAEAEKEPGRPMSMGVCDEAGHMVCFCRSDGASDFTREMVFRKTYTAAQWGDSTAALKLYWRKHDILFYNYNHPLACCMPGGVPIVPPGTEREVIDKVQRMRGQIGATAVSGRKAIEEDERIAKAGLKAIQEVVWGTGK